jgi:NAD-dependent DNA ligase
MLIKELERRQRQLIVHSFIYYELDDSIWTDNQYDGLALVLEEQKKLDIWKESKFYSIFKDWDSSTGISLVTKEDYQYYQHFRSLAIQLTNNQSV